MQTPQKSPPPHHLRQPQSWPAGVDICCNDIQRHRPTQERFWVFQRFAWVGFALIIIAALAGLTGAGGVLSRSVDTFPTGAVDVPIITRVSAVDDVLIQFAPGSSQRRLHLSRAFLNAWQIETIQPDPSRSIAEDDGILFYFSTAPRKAASVHLFVKARQSGVFNTEISIDGQTPASHSVVVLP